MVLLIGVNFVLIYIYAYSVHDTVKFEFASGRVRTFAIVSRYILFSFICIIYIYRLHGMSNTI